MRIEIGKNKVFLKLPKKKLEIHPIWLRERARLSSLHDKNTDHYKRHYSKKQFENLLKQNFNFASYEIYERGNGLECIAVK